MKKINNIRNIFLLILFLNCLALFGLFTPKTVLAANDASFSMSPSGGNYQVGTTLSISISETSASGDNVNAVQANLSYNTSELQYASTILAGPFTICAQNSGGGGSVNIACASSSAVSSTQTVAIVNFTVLATGTTPISMRSGSDIDDNTGTSVWGGSLPSTSFNLSRATNSSGGSSGSSSNNTTSMQSCSSQAPSSAPHLYEIDVTDTIATLFFAPAGRPYDSHFISYGQGNSSEGYGINFPTSQSSGALYYVIRELSPGTVYTFKIRGGNGCKPGSWSNTFTILTLSRGSSSTKKYFSNQQAPLVQSTLTSWFQQAANFISDRLPGVPETDLGAPKKHMKITPTASLQKINTNQKSSNIPSLWENVVTFFSDVFHAL